MADEPSLSYYLPIAGGRIIGFIPFPRVLVLCEMQSVSSRIWTRVAVSISYDDNDYTTGTSTVQRSCYTLKPRHCDHLTASFMVGDYLYIGGKSSIFEWFHWRKFCVITDRKSLSNYSECVIRGFKNKEKELNKGLDIAVPDSRKLRIFVRKGRKRKRK